MTVAIMLLCVDCGKKTGPIPEPLGFRICRSLGGGLGTSGGSITPTDKDASFLVISLRMPVSELMPTEAEYKSMKARHDARATDPTAPKTVMPARENCRMYTPERFTVILADGRGIKAQLIDSAGAGFSSGFSSSTSTADEAGRMKSPAMPALERIEVACIVKGGETRPPFCVQLDRRAPQPVPGPAPKT